MSRQVGDDDTPVVADDDEENVPFPADQQSDLSIDLPGDLGQVSRHFMGKDPCRRYLSAVELFDSLDLRRFKAGQVSISLFDGRGSSAFLLEFLGIDPLFHGVEKLRPRIGPESRNQPFGFFRLALGAGEGLVFLARLEVDLENMGALTAFVIIQRHRVLQIMML